MKLKFVKLLGSDEICIDFDPTKRPNVRFSSKSLNERVVVYGALRVTFPADAEEIEIVETADGVCYSWKEDQ